MEKINKLKRPPAKIIRGIFWFWTLLFYAIAITEIHELSAQSIGERKIMMLFITGFLFIVHLAMYLAVMFDNIRKKYFSKLELILCLGGGVIYCIFFFAMRNNAGIIIQ